MGMSCACTAVAVQVQWLRIGGLEVGACHVSWAVVSQILQITEPAVHQPQL